MRLSAYSMGNGHETSRLPNLVSCEISLYTWSGIRITPRHSRTSPARTPCIIHSFLVNNAGHFGRTAGWPLMRHVARRGKLGTGAPSVTSCGGPIVRFTARGVLWLAGGKSRVSVQPISWTTTWKSDVRAADSMPRKYPTHRADWLPDGIQGLCAARSRGSHPGRNSRRPSSLDRSPASRNSEMPSKKVKKSV